MEGRWLLAVYPPALTTMTADASTLSPTLLEQIDAQQNELLDELDALNARIEQVLKANSACFGIVVPPSDEGAGLARVSSGEVG